MPRHLISIPLQFISSITLISLRGRCNITIEKKCTLDFGCQLNSRRSVVSSQNDIPSRMVLIFTPNHINIINNSTSIYLPLHPHPMAAIFQVSIAKVIKEPQFPFLASPAFGDAESAGMPTRSFCRWCKNRMG